MNILLLNIYLERVKIVEMSKQALNSETARGQRIASLDFAKNTICFFKAEVKKIRCKLCFKLCRMDESEGNNRKGESFSKDE